MRKPLLSLILLMAWATTAHADDVTLKSGKTLTNLTLVKETTTSLVFLTLDGKRISLERSAVLRHERKPTARDELKQRESVVNKKDATALFELAKWCQEQGLDQDAKGFLRKVISVDRKHVGAHEALGHKELEGKWLDANEYERALAKAKEAEYKARGFKKHDGRWVSPLEFARLKAGYVQHGDDWVPGDIKKKIDSQQWTLFEGAWVSPKDKEKLDAGQRKVGTKWMSIAEADDAHADFSDPWIIPGRFVEIRSNTRHKRVLKLLAMAEDMSKGLEDIFGQPHPDLYGDRGRLVVFVGKSVREYSELGSSLGSPDKVAYHSSKYGGFYSPKAADNRGAGLTYNFDENDHTREWVGHVLAHAYLDRYKNVLDLEDSLVEALAGYTSAIHGAKYAPTWWYYSRYLNSADSLFPKSARAILERVNFQNERSLGQAGFFLHYLRTKNPEAFSKFWIGFVGGEGTADALVKSCTGGLEGDALNEDFGRFLADYKQKFKPWDK